jgi:hypothetical protein
MVNCRVLGHALVPVLGIGGQSFFEGDFAVKHFRFRADFGLRRNSISPLKLAVAALGTVTALAGPAIAQSYGEEMVIAQSQSDWNPRRAQIQQVHSWLKKLGYNPGRATGSMSEDLRLALRLYQRDNDLSETGRLTRKVYDHLKANAAAVPDPAPPQEAAVESPAQPTQPALTTEAPSTIAPNSQSPAPRR